VLHIFFIVTNNSYLYTYICYKIFVPANFFVCVSGLPTPSEDAIKWRSEEAETVTFFVNAIPSVTLVPSLLYEINCSSLLPVDIVTFQLTINSNLPDGQGKKIFMSSKSYDCQVKLVVGGDESEMGISLAITPCTGL